MPRSALLTAGRPSSGSPGHGTRALLRCSSRAGGSRRGLGEPGREPGGVRGPAICQQDQGSGENPTAAVQQARSGARGSQGGRGRLLQAHGWAGERTPRPWGLLFSLPKWLFSSFISSSSRPS